MNVQKSYSRLSILQHNENWTEKQQASSNPQFLTTEPGNMRIRDILAKKVPHHWHQFLEDAESEICQVVSSIYDGGVSKGLKHGQGSIILPSGDIFKGNWKNDLRHGSGICKFTNGAIYKGEWREGRPQGQGILFSSPNEILEARFDGWKVQDGSVKLLFANGEFYEGNMREGIREG